MDGPDLSAIFGYAYLRSFVGHNMSVYFSFHTIKTKYPQAHSREMATEHRKELRDDLIRCVRQSATCTARLTGSGVGRLLAKNRAEYHIEYRGYLSNHMSHYLIALLKLGGTHGLTLMMG